MTKEEYLQLYEKWLKNDITAAEIGQLQSYRDEFELTKGLWDTTALGAEENTGAEIRARVNLTIQKNARTVPLWLMRSVSVAAMLVITVSAGVLFRQQEATRPLVDKDQKTISNPGPNSGSRVETGAGKAVLTLDDGSVIDLENAGTGALALQGSTSVRKTDDGQLIYDASNSNPGEEKVAWNTISTPRGGRFQVVLPDGTLAWLNAGSSLRFPVTFTGDTRDVTVKGEVYFEVTKNRNKPFLVSVPRQSNTGNVKIQVLGTHFNVSAYPGEQVKTTLLEGSVKMLYQGEEKLLKPGFDATIDQNSKTIEITRGDPEKAVGWKNGYFVFRNENIRIIMEEIARAYDIEVVFNGEMTDKDFAGTVARYQNVEQVLKVMELTGIVHFHVEGRRVTVTP